MAASPAAGAPTRLRHRLSFTSPLFAQYSALQISPSGAALAGVTMPDNRPAPTPKPALLRTVRRSCSFIGRASKNGGSWLSAAGLAAIYQIGAAMAVHSRGPVSSASGGRAHKNGARGVEALGSGARPAPNRRKNAQVVARGGAIFPENDRLESHRRAAQPGHHRGGGRRAVPHAAPPRRRRGDRGGEGDRISRCRGRRRLRRRRLFHAHVLRPVRAAHHRPRRDALPHRRALRLLQLCGRPQYRRHRVHRRGGALPHLFGLRADRDRSRQDLLRRGPHLLAGQRHRARA